MMSLIQYINESISQCELVQRSVLLFVANKSFNSWSVILLKMLERSDPGRLPSSRAPRRATVQQMSAILASFTQFVVECGQVILTISSTYLNRHEDAAHLLLKLALLPALDAFSAAWPSIFLGVVADDIQLVDLRPGNQGELAEAFLDTELAAIGLQVAY